MSNNKHYFNNPAVSQSELKTLLYGIGSYKKPDPKGNHFKLGDAVDILLTQSKRVFNEKYYLSKHKHPSQAIINITDRVYESYPFNDNPRDIVDSILEACNYFNYQPKWKDKTRINKVLEENEHYWNELTLSQGRIIIDSVQKDTVFKVVESLKTHEHTAKYFKGSVLGQLDIYFTYKDVECKALLDLVQIDRKNKTLQPLDVKTIGDYTSKFKFNAKKYRYDIQAAWYTLALSYWKTWTYPDYTILPFKFLVESTTNPGYTPLVYTCTKEDLLIGKWGLNSRSNMVINTEEEVIELLKIKGLGGYEEALSLYKWYKDNGMKYDKHIIESQGDLDLNLWT